MRGKLLSDVKVDIICFILVNNVPEMEKQKRQLLLILFVLFLVSLFQAVEFGQVYAPRYLSKPNAIS